MILDLLLQLVELRPLPLDHEAHRGLGLHHPLAPLDVEDLAALEVLLLHADNVSQLDELGGDSIMESYPGGQFCQSLK